MLCISTFLAIRDAIAASGAPGVLPDLIAPATPEAVLRALDTLLPAGEGGPKGRMRVGGHQGGKSPGSEPNAISEAMTE